MAGQWRGNTGPVRGTVEYRRQASFRLSRICRESPLIGRPVFSATLLSLSRPAHWPTVDTQGTGMAIPALGFAFGCCRLCAVRPGFSLKRKSGAGAGLGLRPSAPAVGQLLGVAHAAGVCATEARWRTVPQERPKQGFPPFRAGSAAAAGMPAVLSR